MQHVIVTPEHFLGCDWGSTSFRLRLVDGGSRRVLAEQSATKGIKAFASLAAADRSAALAGFLAERLAEWPEVPPATPLVVSGMASSSAGWHELPYASTPFPLDGAQCQTARVEFAGPGGVPRSTLLVSGVQTGDDVLRGEECALIGAHALRPGAPGRTTFALLAGTHPKHAVLRDGHLISFRTHLTGELFDALGGATLLAASVDRTAAAAAPPDLAAFRAGVARVRAEGLSAALFQVRARHLLQHSARLANTWFLSGLLVGAELERTNLRGGDTDLLLVGDDLRVTLYREALRELGFARPEDVPSLDLAAAIIAGQAVVLRNFPAALQASPRRLG